MNTRSALRLLQAALFSGLLLAAGTALAAEALEVDIRGIAGAPLDNVRASLDAVTQGADPDLTADRIQALHQRADGQIRRTLQPFGYYRPVIDRRLDAPTAAGEPWRASYRIDAGTAIRVEAVELEFPGADAGATRELQALRPAMSLQPGDVLDHRVYEEGKRALLSGIREQGFRDATLAEHRIELDLDAYQARIILSVATGPRYLIGPITFQQSRFSRSYLERYLVLHSGQTFKPSGLSRQRRLLSSSGHFSDVLITPGEPVPGPNPLVPLTIQLEPFPANRYRGRVGWGTDTGFGLGLDWTRRYLGKRGHQFNAGAAIAEERERLALDLSYTIPLDPLSGSALEINGRHESKDLNFEDVDLDEGGDTRIATNLASLIWHMPVRALGGFSLRSTAGLSLVGESYDIFEVLFGNLPGKAQDTIIDAIGPLAYETLAPEFEAVVPSLSFKFRRSDEPLYIRRGDYLSVELLGTDQSFGSNIDFWQLRLSSWNIWPVAERGRFLLRSNLGYTDAETRRVLGVNFNQMPEYYEFRAGGGRSIRGYGFETLFPDDALTGGKHIAVASVEYEHEFIPDWSVAAFVDAGNAFNDLDDFEEKLGAGIGLRWRSPVGLARIDLGFPLDDAEDAFQIYITVGPEF
ncbi:hypothetical protein E2F43_03780 [Seongchinamella unica]|uniref:Uncharacterized protein n=1 Tax=Seongchinamella unica TaxID=2547392 RepID=A0A4R5LVB2_9GAMM|nr:BamA/TamA family outer membrane protein [Seongchinamella unica]TDG15363.1 hypothetical protein E2F43_03780 [Seongchinamella unica]